jgi:hypothetical protein
MKASGSSPVSLSKRSTWFRRSRPRLRRSLATSCWRINWASSGSSLADSSPSSWLKLIEGFTTTGRIVFTGPEYQAAKLGVDLMDELARIVDRPTAVAAAEWSEERLQHIVAAAEAQAPKAAA